VTQPQQLQARREDLPLAGRTMRLRNFKRSPEGDERAPLARARLVFSAGGRVPRYDWLRERPYLEELVVQPGAVRLERLKRGAPLLNAHNAWSLEAQLGVVESPSISRGLGECDVVFSRRESVAGYVQDVADRVIRNVSVGYVRHRVEMLPPEQEGGPWIYRVTDWEPYEVSLVPIPADMDAQVRSAGADVCTDDAARRIRTFPCEFIEVREPTQGAIMPSQSHETDIETDDSQQHLSRSQRRSMRRQGVLETQRAEEEIERSAAITELCLRHGLSCLAADFIREGLSLDEVRPRVLEELARRDAASGGHINVRSVDSFLREGAGQGANADLVLNTMVQRLGGRPEGEVLRGASWVDLAMRTLDAQGVRVDHRESRDRIITRALNTRAPGLHTTSDFPNLLGDAVGRVLQQMYDELPVPLRAVAREANLRDFRERKVVRLGSAPELQRVNEHGEFTHGTMGDAGNAWRLDTFGRIFGITRQALVNDDLGAFDSTLRRFAESGSRLEGEMLTSLVLSNPTVDGASLFDPARNTQIADVLGIAGLGAAVAKLRAQREADVLILQEPGFLVVPAALEMTARQLVATFMANQASNVQPWKLEVVVEPRLDATSTTAWYLVASNQRALEYGYLEGAQGIQTFVREGFEVDGVEIKARLDFGCGWAAPVGWVKSTGAGGS
jgi:hypothetical protein